MELGLKAFKCQKLQTWGTAVFINDSPDPRRYIPSLSVADTHTHTLTHLLVVDHMSGTSDHQDLDLVLLVRPVEERDAGVIPEERWRFWRPLGVLDLLEQLHDLPGRAVLFGPDGLGVDGGKCLRGGSLGGLGQRNHLHCFCRKGEIMIIQQSTALVVMAMDRQGSRVDSWLISNRMIRSEICPDRRSMKRAFTRCLLTIQYIIYGRSQINAATMEGCTTAYVSQLFLTF